MNDLFIELNSNELYDVDGGSFLGFIAAVVIIAVVAVVVCCAVVAVAKVGQALSNAIG